MSASAGDDKPGKGAELSERTEQWLRAVAANANANPTFNAASRWLDMTLVLGFGARRFWFKLYRGRIIDAMVYNPATNMLGYDVIVSGPEDAWARVASGEARYAREATVGVFSLDGNRPEAEKSYKAQMILGGEVIPAVGLPPAGEA
jgi:hypothetical protein